MLASLYMNRSSTAYVVCLFCFLLLAGTPALGAVLFYEGFDYNAGTLVGKNGGTGFSGAWNAGTVIAQGLNYTDANGNSLVVSGGAHSANSAAAFRDISFTLGASTQGTFWLTYLMRPLATASGLYGGVSLFNGASENLFTGIVTAGTEPRYRLQRYLPNSSAHTSSSADPKWAVGQTDFIVIRLDLSASASSDNIYMWVNPVLDVEPSIATALLSRTGADVLATRIRMGHNNAMTLDELRFGTTWQDVAPILQIIPEPSSFAMAALGLVLLGRWLRVRPLRSAGRAD